MMSRSSRTPSPTPVPRPRQAQASTLQAQLNAGEKDNGQEHRVGSQKAGSTDSNSQHQHQHQHQSNSAKAGSLDTAVGVEKDTTIYTANTPQECSTTDMEAIESNKGPPERPSGRPDMSTRALSKP
ncbi:hypothetical protein SARC_07220 [Sphaeroforma arctica JP610]|uniref:Uncharacterized protein n=1 Tax=Sphaeroforma arctica JP610 TaxID=667725 RepID=A0A0L0FWS8_9EUKA|nr:hypothetical protein SARC_07220 [Sphaeroforma arctica JP610]KNC80413.1 hypothetical protein SARC_07220 [Sphaeroforma arctica JP610]|eukprot:XP_014154315.1 hypothetical protein SARC_07220 [Sphaeroforma arctica JP610]